MGGKKKGKNNKNKLARMSEDERLRYLQHRAELEEEAKRRKQQLIATFMKNKLKKEDAFTRLNVAKINQEWREILRKIKCKELHDELKAVKKECDESIKRKNSVISRLLSDLDESEEIYSAMLHSHTNIIEKLIGISDDRLDFLRNNYESEKKVLLKSYEKDMADYKDKKFKLQKELESVYYGLAERTLKFTKTAEEEFMQKQDELKNSMILKLETITKEREMHMEKLWKEFQCVLNSYLKYTEEYRDEYIDLRNRDAEDTRSIQDHYNEVSKLTERIGEQKTQLINVKDEQDFNINQLIKHKNDLKQRMDKIKEDMENGLIDDKEKLKFLALTGSQVYKKIQIVLKKGKSIIQLIRLCENMETDHQKTADGVVKKKFLVYSEEELKQPPSTDDCVIQMYEKLDLFWMRYNRTRIDCVCLKEEKMSLQKQNRELKQKLKNYLLTVNMTNGQPAKKDERFVNRPMSMKIERVEHITIQKNELIKKSKSSHSRRPHPVTCIEGNLSNAVRHLRLNTAVQRTETYYAIKQ
ncbi:unnamed protein product [Diamesa hyperborea]